MSELVSVPGYSVISGLLVIQLRIISGAAQPKHKLGRATVVYFGRFGHISRRFKYFAIMAILSLLKQTK